MRIVHLSTSDSSGGAARAAYRLHSGLRRLGHDSSMLVAERKNHADPHVRLFAPPVGVASRVGRKLRRVKIARDAARYPDRPAGYEMFSDDRSEHGAAVARQLRACDVINLHWVAGGFLDYQGFFSTYPKSVPLVWRLADMNAFTGGCHYDDCPGGFTRQCGACPQLASNDPADLSHQVWLRKRKALAHVPPGCLHVVGPSRWIADQARRSSLLGGFPTTVIPNGLDTADFAPRDRRFSRDLLGVPPDAKVVLFAADDMANVRKGFARLVEALKQVRLVDNLLLLSFGGSTAPTPPVPFPHLHLGRITGDRNLSVAYSAADLYVTAALQESFGQTVVESMACGTPVVAFATGGIPDMVRPGVTGLLAPTGDTAALAAAITSLLTDPAKRAAMAVNCRRIAVDEYSIDVQARAYARLYETLLGGRGGRDDGDRERGNADRWSPQSRVA